jgi:hypothetical protein
LVLAKHIKINTLEMNTLEYWNELPIPDRKELLSDLYIDEELSQYEYRNLPPHTRMVLFSWLQKVKRNNVNI